MFRPNDMSKEQIKMFSKQDNWSKYKIKRIKNGWAEIFRTTIMPKINEKPYNVLYSEKGSRPNTPVNILVGILIIKSLLGASDEEMIDEVLYNEQIQYALGTLDYEEQPISKNMISNFRMRIFKYEEETGINLFEKSIRELNENILELNKINKNLKRADSLMISSSCKNMTRTELIYKVNELFVKMLHREKKYIPKKYKYYLKEESETEVLYKIKETEISGKLKMLLEESKALYEIYKTVKTVNWTEEFKNLERIIEEQYDEKKQQPRKGKEIKPTSMQTPYDKEATYRYKYQGNVGYVGNIVEAVDQEKEMCLITDWEVAPNVKSDKEFMQEMIAKKKETNPKEVEKIIVDGSYYNKEIEKEAKKSNIEIHPTNLTGRKVNKETNIARFKIKEKTIEKCAKNQKPITSKYYSKSNKIYATFEKKTCEECPEKEKCPIKIMKNKGTMLISLRTIELEKRKEKEKSEEYKKISKLRSGIEGMPSVLRRKYKIDRRGRKGLPYLSMVYSASILAINIKRTAKYQRKKIKEAQENIEITKILTKISKIINLKFFYVKKSDYAF